jgi:two-component system chemotaxis sensor kinase CheA
VPRCEATELDKGLVEKITDPLTHLVRNSCDHGIELPAERLAKGKPEHGTITLSPRTRAAASSSRCATTARACRASKLLAKAREKGIDAPTR